MPPHLVTYSPNQRVTRGGPFALWCRNVPFSQGAWSNEDSRRETAIGSWAVYRRHDFGCDSAVRTGRGKVHGETYRVQQTAQYHVGGRSLGELRECRPAD